MIIFAKADGTVVETKPTPFYQGSSLKGSIYLVAPFPNTNGVTIQFQLPNGNVTKAYPMTPTGEVEGVMLDGYEVSAWTWNVKNAMVTAIPGVVTATITVFNGEPNITYYGDYATFVAITSIESPQTNAYAYCRADGKVYKYDGSDWVVSDITISANDYVKTTIISSFPIIKGTPNALNVSTPSPNEWETIISELNAIGGKVTKPLMTNFTYNVETGESVKTYNNGAVQTVEFPRALPEGYYLEEYQSFTKTEFTNAWETLDNSDYSKMITIENSTIQTNEFDISVFRKDGNIAEKMNPLIVVDKENSTVKIYSNEAYAGYALFFWKGSFIEQNYLPAIENAIENAETATANTNTAIKNAEDIVSEIQTKLDNGDFVGAPFRIYKVYASKAEMEADFENDDVPLYGFAVIETGEVNNPDNAQLYMKDSNSWVFITDLSGAQGIQGPQGRRGKSFLFYYGKVTDKNGNVVTSPEIGVRYNINRDELEEFPMLGDLFIDSAGNIYRVAGIGASTLCVWTEVSVGGAKFSYYTSIVRYDYAHGDTSQYILFPDFANIAKIEIDSFITAEGVYDGYQLSDFYYTRTPQELGITSPVIYDNGQFNSISFVKNVDYSDTEFVLSWYNYDKTLALPNGVEGSYESFKIDNIIFKIYPKEE